MRADTLLICPDFFGYAADITSALERRGCKVLRLDGERHPQNSIAKVLIRKSPTLVAALSTNYFNSALETVKGDKIKTVLVIRGEAISARTAKRLRYGLPNAIFTIYFWDSMRNMPEVDANKLRFFDRAFTFDPDDAARVSRLSYRPLFFADKFRNIQTNAHDIDAIFIGTQHSDRYKVLNSIQSALPYGRRLSIILYYPSRLTLRFKQLLDPNLRGANMQHFTFRPLEREEMINLIARAGVVVDIEHPNQSGLTMRTIEMLGAGKKIITTNSRVREADFYSRKNIAVISRSRPHICNLFFEQPFEKLPPALTYKYSIEGWLDDVLPETQTKTTSTSRLVKIFLKNTT